VLRERIHLEGMPLHLLDTAGLRAHGDEVEEEGMRRARSEMQRADRVLFVIDTVTDPDGNAFREERAQLPPDVPVSLVFNKCDLAVGLALADTITGPPRLTLSALTGKGLEELRAHLKACMGYQGIEGGAISARARHLDALARARRHTQEAQRQLTEARAGELAAEELRAVQQALGEITGEFTSEDLLGRIFAGFCIGK
jgi:tRNA modification GTPase